MATKRRRPTELEIELARTTRDLAALVDDEVLARDLARGAYAEEDLGILIKHLLKEKRGSRGPPKRDPRTDKDRQYFPKIKRLMKKHKIEVNEAVSRLVYELVDAGKLSCGTKVKSHVHRISRKFLTV